MTDYGGLMVTIGMIFSVAVNPINSQNKNNLLTLSPVLVITSTIATKLVFPVVEIVQVIQLILLQQHVDTL